MATDMRGEELLDGRQLFPDHVVGANPGAGAPFAFKLDSRWGWRFRSVRFKLVTDANVANRFVTVDYCDPEGTVWSSSPAALVQAAGATQVYDFESSRRQFVSGVAAQPQYNGLAGLWIPPGWQLQINVAAIQVGDQLSQILLYVDKLTSNEV